MHIHDINRFSNIYTWKKVLQHIIIETKEVALIGYNVFFSHSYSGDGLGATHLGLHLSTHAEKETRYIQYGPLLLFQ
jgi:hypothetical protein